MAHYSNISYTYFIQGIMIIPEITNLILIDIQVSGGKNYNQIQKKTFF